jgi:hypothetical protein
MYLSPLSKILMSILILIVVCCCGSMVIMFITDKARSGDELFEDLVLDPKPESVVVIDSYDGGFDFNPDYCLHFKMSPGDFQRILAAKKWELGSDPGFSGLQCDLDNPAWNFSFPPPLLKDNVITYTFIPRERDIEILFVNSQMTEAYFFGFDGHMR